METRLKRCTMALAIFALGLFAQTAQAGSVTFGAAAIKQMGITGKQGFVELSPKEDYPGIMECKGVVNFDLTVPEGRVAYATLLLARTIQYKTMLVVFSNTTCLVDNFYLQ